MITFARLATPADLDDVLALDALCFYRPWTRAEYERELADPSRCFIYLARRAGTAIAYCAFWRIFDEIHLNNVAVHPEWRRQGVGAALLTHVLAEAEAIGAPNATLEVRASNSAALALYDAAGFTLAGRRRDYYTHPVEDALILWRRRGPA